MRASLTSSTNASSSFGFAAETSNDAATPTPTWRVFPVRTPMRQVFISTPANDTTNSSLTRTLNDAVAPELTLKPTVFCTPEGPERACLRCKQIGHRQRNLRFDRAFRLQRHRITRLQAID